MTAKFTGIGEGVATAKALEAAAGITPVFVVNMPSGGIGLPEIGKPKGVPSKALEAVKKIGLPLAAAVTGTAALPYIAGGAALAWSVEGLMTDNARRDLFNHPGEKYEPRGRAGGAWVKDDKPIVVNVHLDGKQISSSVETPPKERS